MAKQKSSAQIHVADGAGGKAVISVEPEITPPGESVICSGLVWADEATEPAIHMIARRTGTSERPITTSITLGARMDSSE